MFEQITDASTGETTVREYAAEEVASMVAERAPKVETKLVEIKAEARRRITARYPDWKQANMTARAVELVRKGEANWTANEATEASALDGAWAWIKSVREASNAIEARVSNEPGIDVGLDELWPAA